MARVNHKRVKELLNENRSKITDRQFFTSRILAGHFEDIAAAQTRRYRYNRRVRVNLYWSPKNPEVACTDNSSILINCGNKIVTKIRGRNERYNMVAGLFSHELGHVLYTDFMAMQTYQAYLTACRWYPSPPVLRSREDIANEKALWDYCKADSRNKEMLIHVSTYIANILEDAFVENCILLQFPGVLGYSLDQLRKNQLENTSTVSELIEKEEDGNGHIFNSILQIMLSYAKYGEIKYGETPLSDERIQTVFKLIPEIDQAVSTTYAKERWKIVSLIMVRCWNYIEDFLEVCKQKQDETGSGSSSEDAFSSMVSGIKGTTAVGSGEGTPVPGTLKMNNPSATAGARASTRALAHNEGAESENAAADSEGEAAAQGSEENESGETEAVPGTDKNESAEKSESSGDDGNESGDSAAAGSGSPSASDSVSPGEESMGSESRKHDAASEEGGRIPFHQTDSVSEPVGGEVKYDQEYQRERYEKAASDIDRMLDQMAEKATNTQLENERISELNEAAQNISYGNIHSGINVTVHRIPEVDEELVQHYNDISTPLLTISRQLQRSLIQNLKDQQRGGKQTGLMIGRRLDAHALCRNDGKVFYKNALPNETPRISVGLLLDESGSMWCGDRCTYARAAAIILYDFCKSLRIPIMVYGHSTGYGHDVDLYSYAEFDGIDGDDKYRMMDISARGSNRDGAALRFVAEQLTKRSEEVRMLILVSDGQPAAAGYGGTAAEEDLRGIKQEYRRKGLLFVAAAIGDDKQNIERIYGDSFLDITDLNQLPVKLTGVIKRFLR